MSDVASRQPLAPGKLEMVITHLEMRRPPPPRRRPPPLADLALLRAAAPTVAFYQFLYESVGGPWLWYERRALDDESLRAIIQDPQVIVLVPYVAGVPAGYAELDGRVPGEVELAYFGLVPEFQGRGIGPWLLDSALGRAWRGKPERVWVHTCNLDHPAALACYQRAGFEVFDRERRIVDDPRLPGRLPPARAF